jgi:hypothetical protein
MEDATALRSSITLSPAPLEDAEDRCVQVEFLWFGLSEHRAKIPVQTASKQTLLVKSWPCLGSGCSQASKSFRLLSEMMLRSGSAASMSRSRDEPTPHEGRSVRRAIGCGGRRSAAPSGAPLPPPQRRGHPSVPRPPSRVEAVMRPGKPHVGPTGCHVGAEGVVSRHLMAPFLLRPKG